MRDGMKRLAFVGILPVAALILALFLSLVNAEACTRMFWNTGGKAMLVGRTQDFAGEDQATFYVLPKGLNKTGGIEDNPATWTSKYGSLVVQTKQLGVTRIIEGINVAGFGTHGLQLDETVYETRDARKGVIVGRYLQYLLDNAATVSEALVLVSQTQLVPETPINGGLSGHLAIEDASGDSAIVEFIGGQMRVYHGLEHTVLANDPRFDLQIDNLKYYRYVGNENLPLPGDLDSQSRFVRASAFLKMLKDDSSITALDPIAIMFSAIRSLTVPFGGKMLIDGLYQNTNPTLWTVVSDLTNKAVYFSHGVVRTNYWIDMQKLYFQEGAPILFLQAARPDLDGEVSRSFTTPTLASILSLLLH
jgi:penicillin V acylase-like amidase (Ntn superfamily)